MKISKIQVLNFKSFRDSGEIEFKPGFNVVTGQNSAGKTALLEAMTLSFTPSPHRTLRTVPLAGGAPPDECAVRAVFTVTREELFGFIGPHARLLPQPPVGFMIPGNGPYNTNADLATAFLRWLSNESEFVIAVEYRRSVNMESWAARGVPLGKYQAAATQGDGGTIPMLSVSVQGDGVLAFNAFSRGDPARYLATDVAAGLRTRIYRFSAERFSMGRSAFGNNSVLAANAQNLPEAINTLTANPDRLTLLNELLSEILPQVRQISVQPLPSNQVQIIVWPHDPATQRADLAIPLNDCGSGVGQVIAMLYVVLTSDHPQVILLDEPQSFLHPGAVRKLIDVLQAYPQHQYILTTHSPTVISAAEPATVTMARATDGETQLKAIDPINTGDLQAYLADIGARLSDVFGADHILWVEGQTEETCFPRILRVVAGRRLRGTAIVGIRQTGDLQSRDKKKMFQVYQRLSGSSTLMPPALAFVMDSECLTDLQKVDIRRDSQDLARFLPRRMYENYLLSALAITSVASEIDGFRHPAVQEEEVQRLLDAKRTDLKYYCRGARVVPADWIACIDAARILSEIFAELSENRAPYEKTKHSVAITEWMLLNCPQDFRELADWLRALIPIV